MMFSKPTTSFSKVYSRDSFDEAFITRLIATTSPSLDLALYTMPDDYGIPKLPLSMTSMKL
jgi:hypothetical protein